ncbi:hypothetical protein V8E54_006336 [Elaphomyces granulatus]
MFSRLTLARKQAGTCLLARLMSTMTDCWPLLIHHIPILHHLPNCPITHLLHILLSLPAPSPPPSTQGITCYLPSPNTPCTFGT